MIYTVYFDGMRTLLDKQIEVYNSLDYEYYREYYHTKKDGIASENRYTLGRFMLGAAYSAGKKHPTYREMINQMLLDSKDSFVFIITNKQMPAWNKMLEDTGWEVFIAYKSAPLVNENYPTTEPRLNIVVLAGLDHIMRKEKVDA